MRSKVFLGCVLGIVMVSAFGCSKTPAASPPSGGGVVTTAGGAPTSAGAAPTTSAPKPKAQNSATFKNAKGDSVGITLIWWGTTPPLQNNGVCSQGDFKSGYSVMYAELQLSNPNSFEVDGRDGLLFPVGAWDPTKPLPENRGTGNWVNPGATNMNQRVPPACSSLIPDEFKWIDGKVRDLANPDRAGKLQPNGTYSEYLEYVLPAEEFNAYTKYAVLEHNGYTAYSPDDKPVVSVDLK